MTKDGEGITYGYDGSLVTSETLSGTLNQALNYAYNNDFNLNRYTYAGSSVDYTYDDDGLLTGAGNFTITRNAGNGLPEAVFGGALNLTRTFNGYSGLEGVSFTVNSVTLNSWNLTRDNAGRIISKTETIEGITSAYIYTYDSMGRLLTVTRHAALIEEYQYDSISRRTYEMNLLKGISGRTYTYSDEDHLLSAGDTTYQYNPDGFLRTKTQGSEATHYSYSSLGEVFSVTLRDGRVIEYMHDPLGRRISKKIDGVITEKYLWQGLTRLLAVYDGADNLVMRFEYADARMPVAMSRGGLTYYLGYDQTGSLRVLADISGNVVKRVDYDSFGIIITDTNPTFAIPFGFAGGLRDRDTGLVRFGFRDYDPDTGRWTAKDPIGFWGTDFDLYGYCLNDPLSWADPSGLQTWPGSGPVTSPFGIRTDPFTGRQVFHNAIDVANPVGTPVVASDSGVVISSTPSPNGTNEVIIRNNDGSISGYAHVTPSVTAGQRVNEGQSIGTTDLSGRSTGGHIHYTYRPAEGQPPIDPLTHLPSQNNYPQQGSNPCR